ncbi:MAG TPA: ABC transporter substrate-binding protein [Actinobacteria bacterium]|nr:ABC transporter substrate-binding protein [Actinomycetota bacterium]
MVALAAALILVVAACGDDDAGGDPTAIDCAPGETDGNLNFYNWSEYMDPDLISAFETEYGVDVVESYYESNEAMLSQVQAGVAYDLVVPSDYMIKIMIEEGLFYKLDKEALTNYGNLLEEFRTQPYDPTGDYSVAYQYGTTGLGVNLELVGDLFVESWALVFDPAITSQLPGGVSLLNDPRETMGAALYYRGYSINDTSLEHLQEAAQLIRSARAGVAAFDSDQYDENLVNGEVAVAHGYSGNMIVAIGEAENPENFVYILPEEGATLWIDNMAIPTNAAAPCTAHTFIDFILDAENGAQLTNWNYYGTPNEAALPFVEQEVVDFYAATLEADTEVIQDTGDFEINFTDLFAEAKS